MDALALGKVLCSTIALLSVSQNKGLVISSKVALSLDDDMRRLTGRKDVTLHMHVVMISQKPIDVQAGILCP